MIAAGEVVERPASVVKELLENSLDAGATEIAVEVRGGGVVYIRVVDNGRGIPADEVELAFRRFATSKVSGVADLEGISTLGFRGEALPSIAAVAGMSLVTRSPAEEFGTRIDLADGEIVERAPHGASAGTSVTVRHLFRSVPARRKFLRTTATETSRIHTLATRYALAYPEVRFTLEVDDSESFSTSGLGDLRGALSAIYGLDIAEDMLELSPPPDVEESPGPTVWGLVSPPSVSRANRSYVSLFVNRRWIQDRSLTYALEQAYHGFLMERRYPLAVINVAIPYSEVDVNFHPAKTEVRFRRQNQVFAAVQQAVRGTLTKHSPVPGISHAYADSRPRVAQHSRPAQHRSGAFWPVEPFASHDSPPVPTQRADALDPAGALYEGPALLGKALPAIRVLGQVQNTYIAAEGPDGMYLIDQHASHERVVFERVRAEAASRTPQVQSLLEAATVELSSAQQELVESQGELLSSLGFVVEPFGDRTYLLRGVPALLVEGDPGQSFLDVLDLMAEGGGFESWEERAAYSVACHGAIRAGKVLSYQEMSELTRQLEECQQPKTCPHGRPTMIHLSSSHLEREFGRR